MRIFPYCHLCKKIFKSRLMLVIHLKHHNKQTMIRYLAKGIVRNYE